MAIRMINREIAEHIKAVSLACVNQLDRSVKDAIEGAPEMHASMYRRLVGQVLGEIFAEVLMPLYAAHPDLEPEELRKARHEPQPVVIPLEVGSKLMGVISHATQALSNLRSELALISGQDMGNLDSALQEPIDALQNIRELLHRACPGVTEP